MLSASDRTEIAPLARGVMIIHGALMATVGVYAVLAFTVGARPDAAPPPDLRMMIGTLSGASVLELLAAFYLPGRIAPPRRLGQAGSVSAAFRIWMSSIIVRDAIFEAIAINGLLLVFLRQGLAWFAIFGGVSLALFILFWPRVNAFEEGLEEGRRQGKGSS